MKKNTHRKTCEQHPEGLLSKGQLHRNYLSVIKSIDYFGGQTAARVNESERDESRINVVLEPLREMKGKNRASTSRIQERGQARINPLQLALNSYGNAP